MIPFLVLLLATGQAAPLDTSAAVLAPPAPPGNVIAYDTPDDAGQSITLNWTLPEAMAVDSFLVERIADGKAEIVGSAKPGETSFSDRGVTDHVRYTYRVGSAVAADTAWSNPTSPVASTAHLTHISRFLLLLLLELLFPVAICVILLKKYEHRNLNMLIGMLAFAGMLILATLTGWLNANRVNVILAMEVFFVLVVYFIVSAQSGKNLFVRRIAGLDAVEEAVGRATEMGKPIIYVPGLGSVADIATIASLNILGEVAKKTAQYDSALLVPNRDPIVYTVAREMVKEAYTKAGRPDAFRQDSVFFITSEQFAFAAAVDGLMAREKPATNFFLGTFWAESLILAETGASTGAIQIAGTDSVFQLPFFITACDYTLIGEELYAASAYLSREPLLLGSLKGQDYGKLVIIAVAVIGSALLLLSKIPALSFFGHIAGFFNTN